MDGPFLALALALDSKILLGMGTVVRLEGAGVAKDAALASGSDGADGFVVHGASGGAALALVLEGEVCLRVLAVVELEHAGVAKDLKFARG